ncbi:helix-turn-helix domain-containing protein [Mucilaginibacter ginsenosidivorax]|uniref:Helix-turn-helix transcriptional regulator n=1 Tax=Mucilaginibacter ginsenosidivorax TaxID=862126 RepID=A0A5B8W5N4_9SPHI|nr:helix-turn-helix transcriptional regulator [Mucilaginibacter ginsenosidivorax]
MANPRDIKGIKTVGANIRKYRKLQNLSQQDLANLLDTDLSQVNRIELGKINTTVSMLYAIAEVLKVEPYKFFIIE